MVLIHEQFSDITESIVALPEAVPFNEPFAKLMSCNGVIYEIYILKKILIGGPPCYQRMVVAGEGTHPVCAVFFYNFEYLCFQLKVTCITGAYVDGVYVHPGRTVSLANNSSIKMGLYEEGLTLYLPRLLNDKDWKILTSETLGSARVEQEETTEAHKALRQADQVSETTCISQQESDVSMQEIKNMDLYELIGRYRNKNEQHPFPFFLLCVYVLKNHYGLTAQGVATHISLKFLYYSSKWCLPLLKNEVELALQLPIFRPHPRYLNYYTCRLHRSHQQRLASFVKLDITRATSRSLDSVFPSYAMIPQPIDRNFTLPLHTVVDMDVVKQQLKTIIDTTVILPEFMRFYLPKKHSSKTKTISHVISIYDMSSLSEVLGKLAR